MYGELQVSSAPAASGLKAATRAVVRIQRWVMGVSLLLLD